MYNQKFYFFRCYHCGEWFYSTRIIKTKKCWKCNRSFLIKKSLKFTKNCSTKIAITIIKELKNKMEDKGFPNFYTQI